MDEVRQLLEFDKIIDLVKRGAISEPAQEQLQQLPFLTSRTAIESALQQVSELHALLQQDQPFPLAISDVRKDLESAQIAGFVLREPAFVRLYNNLISSKRIFSYLKTRAQTAPKLWEIAGKLVRCKEIEDLIPQKIDTQTASVKSTASAKLAQLRSSIQKAEIKAQKALESLNRKYAEKGYLRDDTPTIKDGRLVLSIKAEHKNKVPGLAHDQSATGQTFFIEPLESLQLNNEILSLQAQEREEITRILQEMTTLVHRDRAALTSNFDILCQFDFIHAKAQFARDFQCCQPSLNDCGLLDIFQARHPLLLAHKQTRDEVVPLDLAMPSELKTLVITGPNAGGKSVTLKTVGLLTLMLQCGLLVPLSPDSTLPVFQKIFADIGDFQSIEQDLSTFTSHVRHIGPVLREADAQSLVLIDEIGIGTDPAEGAALAIALLEELTRRGCKTIVTTHHGNLKAFAHDTPGVENASMEF